MVTIGPSQPVAGDAAAIVATAEGMRGEHVIVPLNSVSHARLIFPKDVTRIRLAAGGTDTLFEASGSLVTGSGVAGERRRAQIGLLAGFIGVTRMPIPVTCDPLVAVEQNDPDPFTPDYWLVRFPEDEQT